MNDSEKEFQAILKAVDPPEKSKGVMEAIQTIAPGLSLSKILSDIGKEMIHLGEQGSHEVAAALFTGSAFVMYPHGEKEDPQQGIQIEPMKQIEMEQSRGGMER